MDKTFSIKNEKTINNFKCYFKTIWKGSKPLIKLFKTNYNYYIYNTGTNKILKCSEPIFYLLNKILTLGIDKGIDTFLQTYNLDQLIISSTNIKDSIESEKILSITKAKNFGMFDDFSHYQELIDNSMELLLLELTNSCNLRCKYCVYNSHFKNRRNHGSNSLSTEIAFQAINFLKKHSSKTKNISISYYGGEPLLEFGLLKSSVEYAKSIFFDKPLEFSLTTNGTLLTLDISRYLHENNFKVIVSIDGPEEIHNRFRQDANSKGSFKRTMKGLQNLLEIYRDVASEKIYINMVYTPPFSESRLNRISQLWEEVTWLPHDLNLNISYPSSGSIPTEIMKSNCIPEDMNLQEWSFEKFHDYYIKKSNANPIANSVIEKGLSLLVQRPIFQEPIDEFTLNGCCIPGVRRLLIDTYGNFHICERTSIDTPYIGNISTGIDFNLIEKIFINKYKETITPHCSNCWAVGICDACYTDIFRNGKLDFQTREINCNSQKKSRERFLKFYCSLIEIAPKGLDYLYKYKFK